MPKPVVDPLWATAPAVPNVEPLLVEKQAGWPVGYEPPAQWFNWWMNLVYLWCVWLRDFEITAHTWTALQTYSRGIITSAHAATSVPGIAASGNGGWAGGIFQGGSDGTPGLKAYTGSLATNPAMDVVAGWLDDIASLPLRVYRESAPGVIDADWDGIIAQISGKLTANYGTFSSFGATVALEAFNTTALGRALDVLATGAVEAGRFRNVGGAGPAIQAEAAGANAAIIATHSANAAALQATVNNAASAAITAQNMGIGYALSMLSAGTSLPTLFSENTGGGGAGFFRSDGLNASLIGTNLGRGGGGLFSNTGTTYGSDPALVARNDGIGVALEVADGHAKFTGAQSPTATDGFTNTQTPMNILKGMARIQLNNTATPTILKLFNVSSIAQDAAGIITVNWSDPFADGSYLVQAHGSVQRDFIPNGGGGRDPAFVNITIRDYAGTQIDRANSSTYIVEIFAWGDQP